MLGIAEAKRRFAELVDRVQKGERFVVSRRGRPAVALVRPTAAEFAGGTQPAPKGLAAGAGALADWEDLPDVVEELYAARRRAEDRSGPDLG